MARLLKNGQALSEQIRAGVESEVTDAARRLVQVVDPIARRKAARNLAVLMAWRAEQ